LHLDRQLREGRRLSNLRVGRSGQRPRRDYSDAAQYRRPGGRSGGRSEHLHGNGRSRRRGLGDDMTNKTGWRRREFVRAIACAEVVAGSLLNAAEPNIRWALGLVTWRGKAEWPEILADVDAAGFDGVEPFTAK